MSSFFVSRIKPYAIRTLGLSIIFLCVFLAISCRPSASSGHQIVHAKLGQYDLYIPKAYLNFKHTGIGPENVLLQAWYPGNALVPSKTQLEMVKEDIWWKNVLILVSVTPPKAIAFDEGTIAMMGYFKATRFIGDEYGLKHYSQPITPGVDGRDFWIEINNERILSYITCAEKHSDISVPKCEYYSRTDNEDFLLQITFDRRYLPDWNIVANNVKEMFYSFHSPDTANHYINQVQNNRESRK